jgi:dUTPase
MGLCDLSERITDNPSEYKKYSKSSNSPLFINDKNLFEVKKPFTLKLTVANYCDDDDKIYAVPEEGIKIKPKESKLIVTRPCLAVPLNMYGVIYGLGTNIFRYGFVSSGKINPGFNGNLMICYYNGSKKNIVLKQDYPLACCSFFDCETTVKNDEDLNHEISHVIKSNGFLKIKSWIKINWSIALPILISIVSLVVSIILRN